MKVLLLNGPPGSGKDTAAKMLAEGLRGQVFFFASPLKTMTHAAFGVPWMANRPDLFESQKDDPNQGPAPGVTWRQAYIAMSERYVKPLLGIDYFGRVLAETIAEFAQENGEDVQLAIVADSGFREEAEALKKAGHELARFGISRDGCSFSNDSRSYWDGAGIVEPHLENSICNNGSLDDLQEQVNRAAAWLEEWLKV